MCQLLAVSRSIAAAIILSVLCSLASAAEFIFDFEPNDWAEIIGDGGFFNAGGSPNDPDFSGGFGNAIFDDYSPLEFVNAWIVPSNGTFPATSGFNKLQTYAGPGADTVIRSTTRPFEYATFTVTSNSFGTLVINGDTFQPLSRNPGSWERITIDRTTTGPPITELRFQGNFFAIDQLWLQYPRATLLWDQPVDGFFNDSLAWRTEGSPVGTPGGTPTFDDLVFDHEAAYTVNLLDSRDVASIDVRKGDVTIDIAPGAELSYSEQLALNQSSLTISSTRSTPVVRSRFYQTTDSPDGPNLNVPGAGASLTLKDYVNFGEPGQAIVVETGGRFALKGTRSPANTPFLNAPRLGGDLNIATGNLDPNAAPADKPARVEASAATIDGSLRNVGVLALVADENKLGGEVRVSGDFIQSPEAALEVNLLSATNGRGNATKLVVDGTATLGGTLRIQPDPAYSPTPGDFFTVLQAESIYGGMSETPTLFQGFDRIEGLVVEGRNDVFFGVDFDTRRDGDHRVDIVALETPKSRSASGPPASLANAGIKRNLVLITHGNRDSINGDNDFDGIAEAMAQVAAENGRTGDFTVATLNWTQFSTNEDADKRFDGGGLDFYESARFGQQYGRMLLEYLAEAEALDPGSMASIQVIAHSNGNYVGDAIFDVLTDSELSPFGGSRPAVLFHTALDAHLPPQEGDALVIVGSLPFIGEGGPELGELADNADFLEQYFSEGLLGTDNNPVFGGEPAVNFDITGYVGRAIGSSPVLPTATAQATHNEPIAFYLDTVTSRFRSPTSPTLTPLSLLSDQDATYIRESVGFSLSPLAMAIGIVPNPLFYPEGDLRDGDIDLVSFRTQLVGSRLTDGRPTRTLATVSGIWSANDDYSVFVGSTQSPAVASLVQSLEGEVNAISFDFDVDTMDSGGWLSVYVEQELVLDFDLSDMLSSGFDSFQFELLPFEYHSGQDLSVTFRLDPVDGGELTGTFSNIEFYEVSIAVIPEPTALCLLGTACVLFFPRRIRRSLRDGRA